VSTTVEHYIDGATYRVEMNQPVRTARPVTMMFVLQHIWTQ